MLTINDVRQLTTACRILGKSGLNSGISAEMPRLMIDVLQPPCDFLGVGSNPAIFINQHTYRLLSKRHKNWIVNETIAIKSSLFEQSDLNVIGTIIHEVGHAFNVAAKLPNTEANAYLFEIEVLLKLFAGKYELLNKYSAADLRDYFKSRLPYYKISTPNNADLASLVDKLNQQFKLDPSLHCSLQIKTASCVQSTIRFFTGSKPKIEYEITLESAPSQVC